jgi:hypothetical protein
MPKSVGHLSNKLLISRFSVRVRGGSPTARFELNPRRKTPKCIQTKLFVERLIFRNCGTGDKVCRASGQTKSLTEFHRSVRSPDGRTLCCRPCNPQRHRVWRAANRQRYLAPTAVAATKFYRRRAVEQPLASFYRKIGIRDERFGPCKACVKNEALARQLDQSDPHQRAVDRWRAKHPKLIAVARRVQSTVRRAISAGKLDRTGTCERCQTACKPEAAHADYARRIDVAPP